MTKVFPLGDIELLKPEKTVVGCSECHLVFSGGEVLAVVDRYAMKEPISGWIICDHCRRKNKDIP